MKWGTSRSAIKTNGAQAWGRLDTQFCVESLKEAIQTHGTPEIFNTDQGAQFTSEAFIDVLKDHNIKISMDGKGQLMDNAWTT